MEVTGVNAAIMSALNLVTDIKNTQGVATRVIGRNNDEIVRWLGRLPRHFNFLAFAL